MTKLDNIAAILVPQSLNKGDELFTAVIGGNEYIYKIQNAINFESNKQYTYAVDINVKGGTITPSDKDISLESGVENWGEGGTETGETGGGVVIPSKEDIAFAYKPGKAALELYYQEKQQLIGVMEI